MVSRKLAQRTNAWLIRIEFFYTYSWVNGLCFGYFQIFPECSPSDQKLRYPLLPMYPDFLNIRYERTCNQLNKKSQINVKNECFYFNSIIILTRDQCFTSPGEDYRPF